MKFISIFKHEPTNRMPTQGEMDTMGALIQTAMKEGWLLATEGVSFKGLSLKVQKPEGGAITVTDGPFAEAKEVLGGYALLQAGSREELITITKRFLEVAGGGSCEIHQLYEMPAS